MAVESVNGVQPQVKQTGGAGKAVASGFIPGLGQLCDGRTKEGLGYMGANIGLSLAGGLLGRSIGKDLVELSTKAVENGGKTFNVSKYLKGAPRGKMIAACLLPFAGLALWVANVVDAYKGNKK